MIVQGLQAIVDFVAKFFDILKTVLSWCLDGGLYVIKAGLFFCFDGLLTAVQSVVGALDLGSLVVSAGAMWSGLPPQMIYVINAIGLPSCLSMLCYAVIIRMIINLVPAAFTRI